MSEDSLNLSRRAFLRTSACAGGGLLISLLSSSPFTISASANKPADAFKFNPFLKIGSDNTIEIILSKVEMGQNIWTTLPMLIAEELDCDWKKITVKHSPPGRPADLTGELALRSTGGSETIKSEFDRYRAAGATARVMLVNAAAKQLSVKPEVCITENGFVFANGKKLSFGELAFEAAQLPVPEVTLRPSSQWKLIGKSPQRLDTPDKINGKCIYGIDIHFEGLLTAVVLHPPVFGGKVKAINASKAKAINGVVEVIEIPTGVAMIATNYWAATQGRKALEVKWTHGQHESLNTTDLILEYKKRSHEKGRVFFERGNAKEALAKSTEVLSAEFSFPYLAHAPMEPLNCTVKINGDQCEVWCATQSPLAHQKEVADYLGMKPENVAFHTPHMGGSFGRRGSFTGDWVMEAVSIAKISGKAIKMIWSREDDITGGYYRPAYVHRASIANDQNGMPVAWEHHIVGQSQFVNTPLEKYIAPDGLDYSSITMGAPYTNTIPDVSFHLHTTVTSVPVIAWRSVGSTHNVFVIESLIDELALKHKLDPLKYRQVLLKDHPRYLNVLNKAAEKAKWDEPLPHGTFRGIAVCEAMGSYLAQVAELSIENKKVKVHRVVCAIDCGIAVNPDGVLAQIEGGIIFGLTAALYGEITIVNGQVTQQNFNDYKILRINETPAIEVHIINSGEAMGGVGEPGVA
ncbi:MAG TPA: molybdopterin cofactor-binding domain-containing protein, partial [Cyclobacteriaceae bacterium]